MCLHLLPHGKIKEAFDKLRLESKEISNSENRKLVRKLMDYIEDTWIESEIWPPSAWSVYLQQVSPYSLKRNVY